MRNPAVIPGVDVAVPQEAESRDRLFRLPVGNGTAHTSHQLHEPHLPVSEGERLWNVLRISLLSICELEGRETGAGPLGEVGHSQGMRGSVGHRSHLGMGAHAPSCCEGQQRQERKQGGGRKLASSPG